LDELLLFLSETTNSENELGMKEIKALKVGLLQVYPGGLDIRVGQKLLGISASRRVPCDDPKFAINQPLVFSLVISVMPQTCFSDELMETMHNVISFSLENPLVLQLVGFDSFVPKQMRKAANCPSEHLTRLSVLVSDELGDFLRMVNWGKLFGPMVSELSLLAGGTLLRGAVWHSGGHGRPNHLLTEIHSKSL
jgi:hypothetical protein